MHFSITREPSSTSKPEVDPPVVLKLEGPRSLFPQSQALSFCSPRSIFPQSQVHFASSQAYRPSVPGLSSLGRRPIVPPFQAYLSSVAGPSSRSFGPIFQAYLFPVPAYLSPVPVLSSLVSSPGPRPIFPQSQTYLPSYLSPFPFLLRITVESQSASH